jgi:hypothetical protein
MRSQWWFGASASTTKVPEGLILGLKAGAAVPIGWTYWSAANGRFLKGTTSDATVNSTANANNIGLSSGSGGSHLGNQVYVADTAHHDGSNNTKPYLRDTNWQGNHSHSGGASYTPRSNNMKFVRAGLEANFELGLVGFATAALPEQALYSVFHGDSGYLTAQSSTYIGGASGGGWVNSASDYHDHITSINWTASGLATGSYYNIYARGGSHGHSFSPSVSASLARALVAMYQIVDGRKLEGLIGIWLGAGVPEGWEYATELTNRYLQFNNAGTGAAAGNNTMSASGTSGTASHGSHFSDWNSTYDVVSEQYHDQTISHNHSLSGSGGYEPNRYYVKFVRYTGE